MSSCCLLTVALTSELCTLSLHDALPILHAVIFCCLRRRREPSSGSSVAVSSPALVGASSALSSGLAAASSADRKSTRLNSSHVEISYAVFCLKKKKSQRQYLSRCHRGVR